MRAAEGCLAFPFVFPYSCVINYATTLKQSRLSFVHRNYGRSRNGTPAKGTIPTAKGVTITILGAISQAGVIDISLKKPQAVSISKKRKANDTTAREVSCRIGTRTEHFLTYISNVMDVLDRNDMKGHF